jgi:hypothetical protein
MVNEKNSTVNTLSNNITQTDTIYSLYLHSKLQKSKKDIKNGNVITIEESKEKMRKKYANFNI